MYTIMLVDDEIPALEYAEELIEYEDYGFEIVCKARSGAEGISQFRKYHPDVVITDVVMPGMNGLAMADEILKLDSECLFILLTAYNEFSYAQQAIKMEVKSYLLKHELYEETLASLLKKMREILDVRKIAREKEKWEAFRELLEEGQINDVNLKELFERYHLSFYPHGTTLLVIHFEKNLIKGQYQGVETEWINMVEKAGNGRVEILSVWEQKMIVLFHSEASTGNNMKNERILNFCTEINSQIQEKMDMDIYTGVSSPMSELEVLESLYKETDKILGVRFFKPGNRLFFLGRTALIKNDARKLREKKLKAFESAVKKWEGHTAESELSELLLDIHVALSSQEHFKEDIEKIVGILYQNLQISISECYELLGKCTNIRMVYDTIREMLEEKFVDVNSHYSPKTIQVLKYIEENIRESLSLAETAEIVGVNSAYLGQVFKKEVGVSFKNFVNQKKIEKSEELLKQGQYRIYEVAEIMGFQTVQHFCNTFKKVTGEAPGKYKN